MNFHINVVTLKANVIEKNYFERILFRKLGNIYRNSITFCTANALSKWSYYFEMELYIDNARLDLLCLCGCFSNKGYYKFSYINCRVLRFFGKMEMKYIF